MIDEKKLYLHIGKSLANSRKKNPQLTQETLANRLNLTRTSISNIERGSQKAPLDLIYRYCETIGVEISDVLPNFNDVCITTSGTPVDIGGQQRIVPEKVANLVNEINRKSGE